jgi:threonine 3-dehydrogenase
MMAVLVTGGAGLLGAALVHLLLEKGEQGLAVLDTSDSPERLADVGDRIDYIRGDLGDAGSVSSAIDRVRPEVIYHLGAMLGALCDEQPERAMRVNAQGTFYVLDTARRFDVRQVLFASSVATFGLDLQGGILGDNSLQRPVSFYGVTKLFSEGVGLFFKRKHGLDFRSIRFPSIVGTGVNLRVGGIVTYTSAMIEESIKGNPYTVIVEPQTRIPLLYLADAARAMFELARAPRKKIKTVNYLIDGVKPTPSAEELARMVKVKIPGAEIGFQPNEQWKPILEMIALPIDDGPARKEWGWVPKYDYEKIIDCFLQLNQEE